MRDALTMARKELLEMLGKGHARRGFMVQAAVLVVLVGVLVPAADPAVWRFAPRIAALHLFFPSALAASIGADAFAGERERRTLETLLATPLGDGAIVAGKAIAAITFSTSVSLIALLASLVTLVASGRAARLPPLDHFAAVLGGALGVGVVATAMSIFISMRVSVARSAQQAASLATLFLGGGTVAALRQLGVPLSWKTLPRIDGALIVVGMAGLVVAARAFRRDRMFEQR